MKNFKCYSDMGSCLIGNKDWTFAVPNIGGDGITEITIFDKGDTDFNTYRKEHKLEFISSVHGTFNIYKHDCAYHNCADEDVITTLSGRYGVYQGYYEVVFVEWI